MKTVPYHNREKLVEWSQMLLERIDVNAEVLSNLLEDAHKDGVRDGYDQGVASCHEGSIVRFSE